MYTFIYGHNKNGTQVSWGEVSLAFAGERDHNKMRTNILCDWGEQCVIINVKSDFVCLCVT